MKKNNQVFETTAQQIKSTTEILKSANLVIYENPPQKYIDDKIQQITWSNNAHGREVSSKAFLTIDQYLKILATNSYQLLLSDYSIIRYSFVFDGAHLVQQNLLWWPCPVKMDSDLEDMFGDMITGIKDTINSANNQSDYIMRSPIRVDYDSQNDKADHPKAHMHLSHPECRINTNAPICFNRFIKFLILNFYPDYALSCKKLYFLTYQYGNSESNILYNNPTRIIFK